MTSAVVSYAIQNFFKAQREKQDTHSSAGLSHPMSVLSAAVVAQGVWSSDSVWLHVPGALGSLMNCWDNSSLLYFPNQFGICSAGFEEFVCTAGNLH